MSLQKLINAIENETILMIKYNQGMLGIPTGYIKNSGYQCGYELFFEYLENEQLLDNNAVGAFDDIESLDLLVPATKVAISNREKKIKSKIAEREALAAKEARLKAQLQGVIDNRLPSRVFGLDEIEALILTLPEVQIKEDRFSGYRNTTRKAYVFLKIDKNWRDSIIVIVGEAYQREFKMISHNDILEVVDAKLL